MLVFWLFFWAIVALPFFFLPPTDEAVPRPLTQPQLVFFLILLLIALVAFFGILGLWTALYEWYLRRRGGHRRAPPWWWDRK